MKVLEYKFAELNPAQLDGGDDHARMATRKAAMITLSAAMVGGKSGLRNSLVSLSCSSAPRKGWSATVMGVANGLADGEALATVVLNAAYEGIGELREAGETYAKETVDRLITSLESSVSGDSSRSNVKAVLDEVDEVTQLLGSCKLHLEACTQHLRSMKATLEAVSLSLCATSYLTPTHESHLQVHFRHGFLRLTITATSWVWSSQTISRQFKQFVTTSWRPSCRPE